MVSDAFQIRSQLLVAAHVCSTLRNISEWVAGDYKQLHVCHHESSSGRGMIKTMTIFMVHYLNTISGSRGEV